MIHPTPLPTRLAGAVASVAVTGIRMAALLAPFHRVSSHAWLEPTPELMARMARCDSQSDRGARARCGQQVLAAHRAVEPKAVVFAAAP